MGYAGYAPGHKVADLATPLQQYLKMVDLVASLDTLEKLTRNCAQAPAEEKFRKVRREDEPGRSEPRARASDLAESRTDTTRVSSERLLPAN